MSGPLGSSQWMYSSSTSFYSTTIDQSLRFDDGDASYLTRTSSSTSTSDKQFTFSCWFKRSAFSSNYFTILGTAEGGDREYFGILDTQNFIYQVNNGTNLISSQVFRDSAAWYHIVVAVNINESTASDRQKIYINGEQITSFSTANYYGSSDTVNFMKSGVATFLGRLNTTHVNSFDGYIAEAHFVDGSTLAPTSFGETSEGIWIPKQYTGSYGTNGFHLDFSTSSFTDNGSDPDVFADQAGSNDFNAYNLAVSDVVLDSPTNNFATFNNLMPFSATTDPVFSEGNLKTAPESDGMGYKYTGVGSTILVSSGKWYAEFKPTATSGSTNAYIIGIIEQGLDRWTSNTSGSAWDGGYIYGGNGAIQGSGNAKTTSWGDTFTTDDVIGVAIDMDNGKLWFSKNGVFQASGDPAAGTNAAFTTLKTYNDTYAFSVGCGQTSSQYHQYEANFGQNPSFNGTFTGSDVGTQTDGNGIGLFKYAPPSGFLALCTSNLPEPAIGPNSDEQTDDNFNTILYTGDGATSRSITGVGFAPDWVWLKSRSNAEEHIWSDTVRGANKKLESSDAVVEDTSTAATLSGFESDGFTGPSATPGNINVSGRTYVAWNWKLGGSSNTFNIDGTGYASASDAGLNGGDITPDGATISTTAGVSIITYTGNGSKDQTIKHGLSSVPLLTIIKDRDSNGNGNQNWWFGSSIVGEKYGYFTSNNWQGSTAIVLPTSGDDTTVTIGRTGTNQINVNETGDNFIMYNFTSRDGFSKIGSYVGNASTDGTFVYTGFRPAWIMLKEHDGNASYYIFDTARDPENDGTSTNLQANDDAIEGTSTPGLDILSNGFKLRLTSGAVNGLNDNYIYLAFAEMPFKYSVAR